jgi:hypothetical protein
VSQWQLKYGQAINNILESVKLSDILYGLLTLKHQWAAALSSLFSFLGQHRQKETINKVCTLVFQSLTSIQYLTVKDGKDN